MNYSLSDEIIDEVNDEENIKNNIFIKSAGIRQKNFNIKKI